MAEHTTELTTFGKVLITGIVAIVVLGGAIFAGIVLLNDRGNSVLVILKAETTPIKQTPADKGGVKINSLDSPVLSLLDKNKDVEEGVEILRPPVSEPEPPPIDVTEDDISDTANTTVPESTSESETASRPKADPAVPKVAAKPADDQADETTVDEITTAINSIPKKRPTAPEIVASVDVDSPSFVAQFSAFKTEARAKNTAAVLSTKHKSRLDGMILGYMRWEKLWRVVTAPMPRADANAFCTKFRSVGQDCIVKLMGSPDG